MPDDTAVIPVVDVKYAAALAAKADQDRIILHNFISLHNYLTLDGTLPTGTFWSDGGEMFVPRDFRADISHMSKDHKPAAALLTSLITDEIVDGMPQMIRNVYAKLASYAQRVIDDGRLAEMAVTNPKRYEVSDESQGFVTGAGPLDQKWAADTPAGSNTHDLDPMKRHPAPTLVMPTKEEIEAMSDRPPIHDLLDVRGA